MHPPTGRQANNLIWFSEPLARLIFRNMNFINFIMFAMCGCECVWCGHMPTYGNMFGNFLLQKYYRIVITTHNVFISFILKPARMCIVHVRRHRFACQTHDDTPLAIYMRIARLVLIWLCAHFLPLKLQNCSLLLFYFIFVPSVVCMNLWNMHRERERESY